MHDRAKTHEDQYHICAKRFSNIERELSRQTGKQDVILDLALNTNKGLLYGPEKMENPDEVVRKSKSRRPTISVPTPWNGPAEVNIESRGGKILLAITVCAVITYITIKIVQVMLG